MDIEKLRAKLIQAARSDEPAERVPYAFEKRIMARLGTDAVPASLMNWGAALWRTAIPCVIIMVLFSGWCILGSNSNPSSDLSQDMERTVLAALQQVPVGD